MADIESVTVRRFVSKLAYHLNKSAASVSPAAKYDRQAMVRAGHAVTSKHDMGSVEFHLLWKGEQRFWLKAGDWTVSGNMIGLEVEGDEISFLRDMTMLMMVAEFDD